jgi:hypothetical protein
MVDLMLVRPISLMLQPLAACEQRRGSSRYGTVIEVAETLSLNVPPAILVGRGERASRRQMASKCMLWPRPANASHLCGADKYV